MEFCDMHAHTNYSDGEKSSIEFINECTKRNLQFLSVTDHDCVDFYLDTKAIDFAKKQHLKIICGCEFVCKVDNQPIEILGYGIDVKKAKEYLDKFGVNQNKIEKYRSDTLPPVFEKYGIKLDYDATKIDFSLKNPNALTKLLESIRNNEKATELLKQENPDLLLNINNLLRQGLNNSKSLIFIDANKIYPTHKSIIDLIHSLGGIASLAHPYQYGKEMLNVLDAVTKDNIDGIECYHFTSIDINARDFSKRDFLIKYCQNHNLLITGGSDYHGESNPSKNQLNNLEIPLNIFFDIENNILKSKNNKIIKNKNYKISG